MALDAARMMRALRGILPAVAGGAAGVAAVLWLASEHPAPPPEAPPTPRAAREAPKPPAAKPVPKKATPSPAAPAEPTAGQKVMAARIAPPWQRYAVPAGDTKGLPRIAVVIDDMGVDRRRSAAAAALPAPLTLAFLPYARDLPAQTRAARALGHELIVHVPMEPESETNDPGPTVLLSADTDQEIDRKLAWALGRFEGFVGINNHMGSRFTKSEGGMAVLMRALRKRGLLFLDSRTSGSSLGLPSAEKAGVPAARRDVFLDNTDSAAEVARRLKEVEALARRNGIAIAIGHPRDATLNQLAAWLPTLKARGFALVPVSAAVAPPG
jgi:polysaccharide deacetylase 2 family uncharacterized protein YibQ